ncbi:MAG: aminodeoxychorismate/anthranilate synthase component II [Candidatus Omnitrophica bacterium]|nr:aminodeoxychorismate/anthranilate synthase component II [Candidatus Omnitrophota bacterium]MCF7898165.1 aminodeoxychorismate/anthranilate synthase component II [Candidatus Omnitrophota bacterium]MCF7909942.1 aminodeoxychorismate/anthranilate synthase component II [Candidatus Omnitrophota bacterium]
MKILVIDNYDSFTYNLVQYIQELGAKTICFRNDKVTLGDLEKIRFDKIIISPGPGRPEDGGVSLELIGSYYKRLPILGVCLGHQCLGYYFGSKVVKSKKIMHGKTSLISHKNKGIFKNIKNPFLATRYHSLILDKKSLSNKFEIIAETRDNVMMAIKLKRYPVYGVQFHPESILTSEGKAILKNFLKITKKIK